MSASNLPRRGSRSQAFTLIEWLVTIAVIGVLFSILIPVVSNIRERAMLSQSTSNLRELYRSTMLYSSEHGGRLPASSDHGENNRNFYTILQDEGFIDLKFFGRHKGDGILFNPLLVAGRKDEIRDSTGASYAVNFWATEGALRDGDTHRDSATSGRLVNVTKPSRMALFMDGVWNGITWPVQIGNWPEGQNMPDFSFPISSIGTDDPNAETQVVFLDGHIEAIARRDFEQDLDSYFWKGRE